MRNIFVLLILLVGGTASLAKPLYAAMFYIWLAYFRPESWLYEDWVSGLNLSYIAGIWILIYAPFVNERLRLNRGIFALALLLLHTWLSVLLSDHNTYCSIWWTAFFKQIVITYAIIHIIRDERQYRLILMAMAFSLAFESAKQGWVTLITHPGGVNTNEIPFLGNNNRVAIGMMMLVPQIGVLAFTSRRYWFKLGCRFLNIGLVYRGLSTYSRGGFLAAGAIGLAAWIRSPTKIRSALALAVVIGVVLPVLPDEYWARMSTIQTYEEVEDNSALGRLHFWKVALDMAGDNPVLGVGFSGYEAAYNEYDFSYGQFGRNRSPHSNWFAIVADLGYVGAALYAAVVLAALRTCWRVKRLGARIPALANLGFYARALETSIVAWMVGGTFTVFAYNEMFWNLIGLCFVLGFLADDALKKTAAISG